MGILRSYQYLLKYWMVLLLQLVSVATIALLSCSDQNPFKDEANARAIMITDLQDGDILEIFSTESLTVKFQVRNLLQKCSLYVEGNRFFSDTCVDFNKVDSFNCNISFYDTGLHQIRLISVRNNGEVIHQSLNLFVKSPLFQPDIKAKVGDSVTLSATGVNDDVFYIWRFSDGEIIIADTETTKFRLRGTSGPEAFLTVSDRKGKCHSPSVRFFCEINDNEAPVITCLNEIFQDTVTANGSNFYFIVKVEDVGGVRNATCNGALADKAFPHDNYGEYVWLIKEVNALALPVQLNVNAVDNFGNISHKVFWLNYDSTKNSSGQVSIKITSPTSPTIKRRQFFLSGEVINFFNSKAGLLHLIIDSVACDTWNFKDNLSGKWNFNASIKNDRNNCSIRLLLENTDGEDLADTVFQVFYDPLSEDIKKPNMVELTVNGQSVTEQGERRITDKNPALFRIIAFDEGDGVSSVTINGNTIHKSDSVSFIWEKEVPITSSSESFTVKITDSANHDTSMFFFLKLNHRPELGSFQKTIKAVVGKKCIGNVKAIDKDGDRIVYKTIGSPSNFHLDSVSGNFVWVPDISDTAVTRVLINYRDNYWMDMVCTLNVIVMRSERLNQSLIFDTNNTRIPLELIADSQSLDVYLKTIPVIDSNQLKYEVRLVPEGTPLLLEGGRLRWTPVATDTGIHRLTITATDIINDSAATLFAPIRVIPKKRSIELILKFNGRYNDSTYDLSDPSLSSFLDVLVHDPDSALEGDEDLLVKYCDVVEHRALSNNSARIFLDAMEKDSGYDTIYVSINNRNKTYLQKRCLYYGTAPAKPVFSNPVDGQMIDTNECVFSWSGTDVDSINKLKYFLYVDGSASEFRFAESIYVDKKYTVRLDRADIYKCKLIVFDGKTSVESDIINIDVSPKDRVRFKNTLSDFPFSIETGDTWVLQLQPRSGTGMPPFSYTVSSSGSSSPVILNDNKSDYATLRWIPSAKDTGIYKLSIAICDSFKNVDILEPVIYVVPPNRPASITSSWVDSVLYMRTTSEPETLSFQIEDEDDPLIEDYSVIVKLGSSERLLIVGQDRHFIVIINGGQYTDEFLEIKIFDQGIWKTEYRLHIYYSG